MYLVLPNSFVAMAEPVAAAVVSPGPFFAGVAVPDCVIVTGAGDAVVGSRLPVCAGLAAVVERTLVCSVDASPPNLVVAASSDGKALAETLSRTIVVAVLAFVVAPAPVTAAELPCTFLVVNLSVSRTSPVVVSLLTSVVVSATD